MQRSKHDRQPEQPTEEGHPSWITQSAWAPRSPLCRAPNAANLRRENRNAPLSFHQE
jgi:hypothetical protein